VAQSLVVAQGCLDDEVAGRTEEYLQRIQELVARGCTVLPSDSEEDESMEEEPSPATGGTDYRGPMRTRSGLPLWTPEQILDVRNQLHVRLLVRLPCDSCDWGQCSA
jgi:hypothetical protein